MNSLEDAFTASINSESKNVTQGLIEFSDLFFSLPEYPERTKKHISSPLKNSYCKRLNMYLRWMVRKDDLGIDFGLWEKIKPAQLLIPQDIHVGRVARKLGLLKRKQSDWEATIELTENLKKFDPLDPVKYDFALFGLGVVDKFANE
jgi:uncharacterized protein (TIGR02757 family)